MADRDRVVAVVLPTLSWALCEEGAVEPQPTFVHRDVAVEAMRWQELSAVASAAEGFAFPLPIRRIERWNGIERTVAAKSGTPPREPNRILEVHGLMGAIGEQISMAWSAEQDVQRIQATSDRRAALSTTLMVRATSELVGHFVLGAAHSMANAALRVLLLNSDAAGYLEARYKVKFHPGSDERSVWPTFNESMTKRLHGAAELAGQPELVVLADVISGLRESPEFQGLDGRRGMDYHRRRPQSVAHTAPREGVVTTENGSTRLRMAGARVDGDADPIVVHGVAVAALERVAFAMNQFRRSVPAAMRAQGINYPYDFVEEVASES